MPNPQSIGDRLRAARESAGLTVVQLAERSGLTRQAVHHIESGKRTNPGIETVRAVCKAAGVSLAILD